MSDKTCTTCRWFKPERDDPDAGNCFRYPETVYRDKGDRHGCGEWADAEATASTRLWQALTCPPDNEDKNSDESVRVPMFKKTCRIMADRASDTDAYWEDTLEMECGATFIWAGSDNPVYCPYCGRKVIE